MTALAIEAMEAQIAHLKGKAAHISELLAQHRLWGKQKSAAIARKDQATADALRLQLEINQMKAAAAMKKSNDDEALEALAREVTGEAMRARVVILRDRYMQFSEDLTRVASMRMMASQISNELTMLLESK